MFEKIFGDYIEVSLGLIVSALLLTAIGVTVGLSNQYHEKELESQIAADEIKDQRNNLFYNNTNVYQQDIVSLIIRYKGDKEVHVRLKNGTTYEWTNIARSSSYKVSDVSALLPKDVVYDSDLLYGPNLYDVIGYEFIEH